VVGQEAAGDEPVEPVADRRERRLLQVERGEVARSGDRRGSDADWRSIQEHERDVLGGRREEPVLRVAASTRLGEPVRVHDDAVDGRVRPILLRVERDPHIVRAEAVRADVDQEVRAVRGRQDDVGSDEGAGAELEPVGPDLDLQRANIRKPVRRVGRAVENGSRRACHKQDGEGRHDHRERRNGP
jgi:hypothetical protein